MASKNGNKDDQTNLPTPTISGSATASVALEATEPNGVASSSAAAAATSSSKSAVDDATVAQVLHSLEMLTGVFGFDASVAQEAIEAVGTDVTQAYNYILDSGLSHDDKGGPVLPIDTCPHLQHHVCVPINDLPPIDSPCSHPMTTTTTMKDGQEQEQQRKGRLKEEYGNDESSSSVCPSKENWICLHCGVVRCSRYVNGHGVQHYEDTLVSDQGPDGAGHCVAVSLSDLSVWCHACRSYLKHKQLLDPILKRLEEMKFGKPNHDNKKTLDDDDDDKKDAGEPIKDNNDKEEEEENSDEEEEEEDDHDDDNQEGAYPVARGVPMRFHDDDDENDDDEIEYPFGSCPTSLSDVAKFILSDRCQSIIILAGAGMSVASGIPDFRSSGGLYDTLRPEMLTATDVEREAMRADPTVALEQGMFLRNPLPCLELNRPFILGTRDRLWKATLAHRFVELLHAKTGKLTRLYQQNIDGLEGQCEQLPRDKVVMVHGSMDRADCALCGTPMDFGVFCQRVERNIRDISGQDSTAPSQSRGLVCDICGYESVKPTIVLFRSPLPAEFFERLPQDIPQADLLIVIGTSLAVAPANKIVALVPETTMRLVVNREPVGFMLGIDYSDRPKRDYFARGDCDDMLLELMEELGWLDDVAPFLNTLPDASARVLRERLERENQNPDGVAS